MATKSSRRKTIALFGLTGRTGNYFAKHAIKQGHNIRALVRDKSSKKVEEIIQETITITGNDDQKKKKENNTRSELLTIIQGDFNNIQALQEVLKGAQYIVIMAAASSSTVDGTYPDNFMLNFIKKIYNIIQNRHSNDHDVIDNNHDNNNEEQKKEKTLIVYQAGSMSIDTTGYLHPIAWIMKQTLGRKLNIFSKIHDNDNTIRYIANESIKNTDKISFIITRAGIIKDEPSSDHNTDEVTASDWPPLPYEQITFTDLAAFTLKALDDESLYGSSPFVK